jgi:hypothetical protein
MKEILILTIAAVLFGCTPTNTKKLEAKNENTVKATSSSKKPENILAPTSSTAIIRTIKAKHMFDRKTVVSTLEKVFDESGKTIYETPLITWNGPKPAISLPAGKYEILVGCWENGAKLYNYHRIKADIEKEKDYTFFCLKQTGRVLLGLKGVVGLYAFYSETPQLEVSQKKYQTEIDSITNK